MSDKLPRPEHMTQDWIDRNKKRLVTNIKEINNKLSDIENAYPWPPDCPKFERMRYDDLYSDYVMYNNQLEELKEIERNYYGTYICRE